MRSEMAVVGDRTSACRTCNQQTPNHAGYCDTCDRLRWYRFMKAWGVPEREAIMLVENNLDDTEALVHARSFLAMLGERNPPNMLVLAGPKGVGKTVAAAYVLRNATVKPPYGGKWASDETPRFRHVSDLVETGLFGGEDERRARSEIKRASILGLDDIGVELKTDPFLALFDSLVNHRYGMGAGVTVFTTNLPAVDFAKRYGERVFDRIRGRGVWYDINHESLRGRHV